jgi:small-conductance mechanosensitive channel
MFQETQDQTENKSVAEDVPGEIDVDPVMALERVDAWVDGFIKSLPNMVVALIVLILFVIAAAMVRRLILKTSESRDRGNLGEVLGGFSKWVIVLFGFLIAATIVVPTLKPGDLIAGLGVSSVAIGFAFKDILQNWLAGLLILLRQPFEIGDQIEASGFEGTVEKIETRATIVKTYDGQRAVIPNSEIYTNAVLVKTGESSRRDQYDIGIGYGDDIDQACSVIKKAIGELEHVDKEHEPQAFVWDLAASWVTIRARWWTDSRRADVVMNKAAVLRAVKLALDEAKIDMPYDTKVQLIHDQTEEIDGDRQSQREGWPVPKDGVAPKSRFKALEAQKSEGKEPSEKSSKKSKSKT